MHTVRWILVSLLVARAFIGASPRAEQADPARAQTPPAPEAPGLAQGWAELNRGDVAAASATGNSLLAQYPNNASVLALAIDTDLARGGALSALDTYERWLGPRRIDVTSTIRRIASVLLKESVRNPQNPARVEALARLAADGDLDAARELDQLASRGGGAEAAALASMGNEKGVRLLLADVKTRQGDRSDAIHALLGSRSPLVVAPLMELLTDANVATRAAAADALGRLGAAQSIERIKPLLKDVPPASVAAAGALYRLNEMSGLTLLRELEADQEPAARLLAAQALSSHPDLAWQALVRSLMLEPQATIRWQAAKLIAPYDPSAATPTLAQLLADESAAVREATSQIYIQDMPVDFAVLRRFLRSTEPLARVRAAGRVLELTR